MPWPDQNATVAVRLVPEAEWQALLLRVQALEQTTSAGATGELEWMAESDVARLLRRSKQWLWRQRSDGRLEYAKVGRAVFYRRRDVHALLAEGCVMTFR